MVNDVEMRLIAPNSQAIKSIREVAAESEKLHKNTEKQHRSKLGFIEQEIKMQKSLAERQLKTRDQANLVKYNQLIADSKKRLDEYYNAGVKVEKQGTSTMRSMAKWAAGFAALATVVKVLKDAFVATEQGLRTFNKIGAVTKQILYDIVTNANTKDMIANIKLALKANQEAENLRVKHRDLIVDIAKAEADYNKMRFDAYDRSQTEVERLNRLNQVMLYHEVLMNKKIDLAKEELQVIRDGLAAAPMKTTLLDAEANKIAEITRLEGDRFVQTREIESIRTGIIKKNLEDIQQGITEEHEMLIDSYLEKRDMFFDYIADLEKGAEEAAKRAEKAKEREWDFETKFAERLYKNQEDAAKAKWDAILEAEEKAKEEEEDLQEARLEALKQGLNELLEFTQTITDRALEDAQRHREILDQRISETQSALQTEVELYKEGYASNVDAKKKELADLKKQRDKALKDEEAALQRKRVMESIAQGVNIFSSATNILKTTTLLGPLGVALAAGAIAAMFTLLSSVRKRSSEIKLASGGRGEVKGRLHSEGGERFLDHVEVEAGERWGVLSRPASRKYGKAFYEMVDSFNKNKPSIPRSGIMINNINNDGPNKRLDEVNSNLRRIHAKEEVLTIGSTVIYKKGSSTRIIKRR